MTRPRKITLGELRESGVCDVLIYCSIAAIISAATTVEVNADGWPDHDI